MEIRNKKNIGLSIMFMLLLFGIPLLLAQISEIPEEKPKEKVLIKQTSSTDHFKLPDGTFEAVLYIFPINVRVNKQTKRFDEAESLMDDEWKSYTIKFLEEDKDFKIDIVDFNITSITFNLNMSKDLQGEHIPIRIWKINSSL